MPLSQAISPAPSLPVLSPEERARRARARNAPLLTGAVCAAFLALLGALGAAQPVWAFCGAGAILATAAVFAWRSQMEPRTAARAGMEPPPDGPPQLPPGEAQTYALALELAPNPVLLVSGEEPDDMAARRVLFANAEARELLRIQREGALLVTAVRNPAVLEAIDEALFGGASRTLSYESGGGQTRYWRLWTKPLPPNGRHGRLALVIMRDETDMRLNERMRADFLANASHELRTPLASLSGFIETLRGHAREDEVARDRFLVIMSRQAERMARLIDDLLSLSRIELSEHIRPGGACDLAMAVSDVVDALAPQIAAKGVRVVLDTPAARAEIVGDRDQIVQVVQNLLDNAVKYAPPGGVVLVSLAVHLTLEQASAARPGETRAGSPNGGRMSLLTPVRQGGERYVLLRVEDGGPGMAREHLPRLTERFYRVEGQKSGERTGTGLGLAIVKHIINRHRGGFVVESAPGCGSAFGVYLPMTVRAAAEAGELAPPSAPPGPDAALDQSARAA
jgi:two-component system, OmpR family, phosphate regulon sensor histidine kinase PhoR